MELLQPDTHQAMTFSMKDINKSFGDVQALNNVSFQLEAGEIRGLVGENGAGKSTLMNVLYGMYSPDSGSITVLGREVPADWSPRKAIKSGIGMIHQHFSLIPPHTVLENVVMPLLGWSDIRPSWAQHRKDLEQLCEEYNFELRLEQPVEDLSIGQQQQVEILKMLYQGAKVLILDEPTGVLTPQQTEGLLNLLRRFRDEGHSIVLITHKLSEAMAISDKITVLRNGEHIATVKKEDTTSEEVASMMVSRTAVLDQHWELPEVRGGLALRVEDLCVTNHGGDQVVDNVSLQVHEGEIVGIAGVSGNGQTELAEALVGLRDATGSIVINDEDASHWSIDRRRQAGLGYIPEDRHLHGIISGLTVAENLMYDRATMDHFSNTIGFLKGGSVASHAEQAIDQYDIRTPGSSVPAGNLSGGNQQKVVLARVLTAAPHIILACQPTRGLDFSAMDYVRTQLVSAAEKGVGVLLVSSELDELLALTHRILVMYEGKIVGNLTRAEYDLNRIGLMMAGRLIDT